jgi:hypothetical protein
MRTDAATVLLALLGAAAPSPSHASSPCEIAAHPERHLGETVTIRGRYLTDGIERSIVVPAGCRLGLGVGDVSDAASAILTERLNSLRPPSPIDATFSGVIIRVTPNLLEFHNDKGYRLSIAAVELSRLPARTSDANARPGQSTSNYRLERP